VAVLNQKVHVCGGRTQWLLSSPKIIPMKSHIQATAIYVNIGEQFVKTLLQYLREPITTGLKTDEIGVIEIVMFE
jgi:hypothetical protein